jgi:hypothetical protein
MKCIGPIELFTVRFLRPCPSYALLKIRLSGFRCPHTETGNPTRRFQIGPVFLQRNAATGLIIPEGFNGIDVERPLRWHHDGEGRACQQQERHPHKRHDIKRPDAKQ